MQRTLRGVALLALLGAPVVTHAQSKKSTKAQKAPARTTAPSESATPAGESLVATSSSVVLRDEPEGHALATLGPGAPMTAVAHDRGWIRVHIDGWVREDSVQVSNGATTGSLSAADLRVDPKGAKGKTVRWDVQVLALETADFLHKDLSPDEPYLLARGPGSDNTLLYVAVPPSMLASAKTLAAAAPVSATLVAIVRVGRSEPVGVPVLDAQSIARR
jgi:hypothetical protein